MITVGVIFLFKRALVVFAVFAILFCSLGVRIGKLCMESTAASASRSAMSFDLETLYGTVYDCNLNPLTNGESEKYVAAKPTNEALSELKKVLLPEVFDSVLERMSAGKPVVIKAEGAKSSLSVLPFDITKRYYDVLVCHIIGYRNAAGEGVSGIEKAYDEVLKSETSLPKVRFFSNAKGKVMLGEEIVLEDFDAPKTGVALTIDKNIQQIVENALDESETNCAAAVLLEIENGAIRACVSRPYFNRSNLSESIKSNDSPLINRAFLAFGVGSVFKPVVAAAALESGITDFEYNCTGSVTHNGVTFNCHKKDGHGVLNLESAVAVSCNTYFIALALETGKDKIIDTAADFGFGKETEFADGIKSSAGNLPKKSELDSNAAIANIAFGQGSLLATPIQICTMMATIADGGVCVKPYLVEGKVDENGDLTRIKAYAEHRQIISKSTAKTLCACLEAVVSQGSGKRAASDSVAVAGKTATAQTGKFENGEEIYNAWFAGYFPADNPKYALAILKENGGEGAVSCAPVFKKIAEEVCSG